MPPPPRKAFARGAAPESSMLGRIAATLLLACLVPGTALGQGERVMRIIVAFPPGGPVDFVARSIADPLGKELGARVIVENKSGANGAIAAEIVAHAGGRRQRLSGSRAWAPSRSTRCSTTSSRTTWQRDFAPVSLVVSNDELLVVNAADPANTVAENSSPTRRSAPDPPPIASTGIGSIPTLRWSSSPTSSKANLLHVPYKGAAPAVTDVMGGTGGRRSSATFQASSDT